MTFLDVFSLSREKSISSEIIGKSGRYDSRNLEQSENIYVLRKLARKIALFLVIIVLEIIFCFALLWALRRFFISGDLLFEQLTFTAVLGPTILWTIVRLLNGRTRNSKGAITNFSWMTLLSVLLFWSLAQFTLLNIDRSRSFFLIAWVDQGKIEMTNSGYSFAKVSSPERLNHNGMVQRVDEQISRGILKKHTDRLELTTKGRIVLETSKFLAREYKLTGWISNSH